ncbi:hypothetical protein LJC41_06630 [Desulfosarcina sp. OttesenSCG-928-G17]|nr:hypothetical protein [Desulfosarcina sp. OttesenSCG-928-G17]
MLKSATSKNVTLIEESESIIKITGIVNLFFIQAVWIRTIRLNYKGKSLKNSLPTLYRHFFQLWLDNGAWFQALEQYSGQNQPQKG